VCVCVYVCHHAMKSGACQNDEIKEYGIFPTFGQFLPNVLF